MTGRSTPGCRDPWHLATGSPFQCPTCRQWMGEVARPPVGDTSGDLELGQGPGGYDRMVDHGGGVQTLWYADGSIKFRHVCRLTDGTRRISAPETFGPQHLAHTMVSRDPLTLSPSILCHQCGRHGFITDGRWVAA